MSRAIGRGTLLASSLVLSVPFFGQTVLERRGHGVDVIGWLRRVFVDLTADGPLKERQRLAQLGLDLCDLDLDPQDLTHRRQHGRVIDIALGIVAPGQL
jgi:hypothetical protein